MNLRLSKKKGIRKSRRSPTKKKSLKKNNMRRMTDGTKSTPQQSDRVLRSASSRRRNPPSLTGIAATIEDYSNFHSAAMNGYFDRITRLHNERNIDLDHIDETGHTALHVAVMGGHENIVRYLIDNGANLNIRDPRHGYTPLMEAVFYNVRSSLIPLLLMEGADDTIVNRYNMTPFDLAVSRNRPYANRELWEQMKSKVSESKVLDSVIKSQSNPSSVTVSDNTPLANFLNEVPASMDMMPSVMSSISETETDPRLLDINHVEYYNFIIGVINFFESLPSDSRVNISFDLLMPFINAQRSTPLSIDRAKSIIKVVIIYESADRSKLLREDPSRLLLKNLTYNKETNTVSLPPDE